ncbi:hypothetical protein Tco_1387315, partial [Tanacetum coccineum]
MPPRRARPLTQAAIDQLIQQRVDATIAAERERVRNARPVEGPAQGPVTATPARECTFTGFMKCNPINFHGNEGVMGLVRWIEKTEMVFSNSNYAEGNKVMFAAATFQGQDLTWWNSQVATLRLEVANGKSLTEMKTMMTEEFFH